MAENQSKEVDLVKELEREYNDFLSNYDSNLRRLTENIGTLKGIWPDQEKRDLTEIIGYAYNYTALSFEWLRFLLDEIKRVRTRTFRKEIELADAVQKTTRALHAIQTWMDKYDPTLRRFEEDYQAALGRATGTQSQQGKHQD